MKIARVASRRATGIGHISRKSHRLAREGGKAAKAALKQASKPPEKSKRSPTRGIVGTSHGRENPRRHRKRLTQHHWSPARCLVEAPLRPLGRRPRRPAPPPRNHRPRRRRPLATSPRRRPSPRPARTQIREIHHRRVRLGEAASSGFGHFGTFGGLRCMRESRIRAVSRSSQGSNEYSPGCPATG
jgi:hypothetical protein